MALGKNQLKVLRCLQQNGHSRGWLWGTRSATDRILQRLHDLGLASRDERGVYHPAGAAALTPPAEPEKLMVPTVNLNGTSKLELLKQVHAAHDALFAALEAIGNAAPHGRDYQTMPAGSYEAARAQHAARYQAIDQMRKDYEALHIAIAEQHR